MQRIDLTLSRLGTLTAKSGALLLAAGAAQAAEKMSFDELPEPVRHSVENLAPNVAPGDFRVVKERGKVYEVSYDRRGVRFEISLTPDGNVFRIEEAFSYRPIPTSARNERISYIASLTEDMVDYSLTGETGKIDQIIARIKKRLPAVRKDVGQVIYDRIEDQLTAIREHAAKNDMTGVALTAVEAYKELETSLDTAAMAVPREVSMLDYSGFKLSALARARPVDWKTVAADVKEAAGYWEALKGKVRDPAVRDLMNSVMSGLGDAVAYKDPGLLRFAARLQLDAVDLLEHDFMTAYKTGKGAVKTEEE